MSNAKKRYSGIVMGGIILLKQRRNARACVRSRHTKQQAHECSTHGAKHRKTNKGNAAAQANARANSQAISGNAGASQAVYVAVAGVARPLRRQNPICVEILVGKARDGVA